MIDYLKRIYNSRWFTWLVIVSGCFLVCAYFASHPNSIPTAAKYTFGGLRAAGALILAIIAFMLCLILLFVTYIRILKIYVDIKLSSLDFKYILVYPEGRESWVKVFETEVEPLFESQKLVLRFDGKKSETKFNNRIAL